MIYGTWAREHLESLHHNDTHAILPLSFYSWKRWRSWAIVLQSNPWRVYVEVLIQSIADLLVRYV